MSLRASPQIQGCRDTWVGPSAQQTPQGTRQLLVEALVAVSPVEEAPPSVLPYAPAPRVLHHSAAWGLRLPTAAQTATQRPHIHSSYSVWS
jgi:hypothetical protein